MVWRAGQARAHSAPTATHGDDLPPQTGAIVPARFQGGIDLAQHHRMPSKDFKDASGMSWRVWNTVPVSGAVINPGFEKGWLTFESDAGALRRLAPIPQAWENLPASRLLELLERASEVPRHTGPMRRVTRPESGADVPGHG
jgi:hypothetical protein